MVARIPWCWVKVVSGRSFDLKKMVQQQKSFRVLVITSSQAVPSAHTRGTVLVLPRARAVQIPSPNLLLRAALFSCPSFFFFFF